MTLWRHFLAGALERKPAAEFSCHAVVGGRWKQRWEIARVPRPLAIAIVAVLLCAAAPTRASIVQRELGQVGLTLRPDAALPLDLALQAEDGTSDLLQSWLGRKAAVLVLADYTCKTLCGPVISIVSDALAHSGLRPGKDFRLIVIGLDPISYWAMPRPSQN
jgi:cytochrome oxidase Cu insertion factor (SCO1/SenC/PrrC family)